MNWSAYAADHRIASSATGYLDQSGRTDTWSGGVRMIEVKTPKGRFKVWTKRVGNNPRTKVLLLHGGPGATHEYFEACDSFFPAAGVEYYYYDQLGSAYSDQPDDDSLWDISRFVEEVEQVRTALGLDRDNFFPAGPFVGRDPRHRVCAQISTPSQGAGDLRHDGERPGLR